MDGCERDTEFYDGVLEACQKCEDVCRGCNVVCTGGCLTFCRNNCGVYFNHYCLSNETAEEVVMTTVDGSPSVDQKGWMEENISAGPTSGSAYEGIHLYLLPFLVWCALVAGNSQ
jgi:hypothetical protein